MLSSARKVSGYFLILALICAVFADLAIISADPWSELRRIASGFLQPVFFSWSELLQSVAYTLAFAVIGVGVSAFLGLLLARMFHWRAVRTYSAPRRAAVGCGCTNNSGSLIIPM